MRHPWPWALPVLGGFLILYYSRLWYIGWARVEYMAETRDKPPKDDSRLYHKLQEISRLARQGEARQAERALEKLRELPRLSDQERAEICVTGIRLGIQFKGAPDSDLDCFLSPDESNPAWGHAFVQRLELFEVTGDSAGQIDLLEQLVDGRVRVPSWIDCPFPYQQNWAAEKLAEVHLSLGDGRRAFDWAWRLKHEFDVDFNAPCGAPFVGEFWKMEEFLWKSAQLAGLTYYKESWDESAGARMRRIYGPPWYECGAAILAGLELAFAGIGILRRRAGRLAPRNSGWGRFWQRQGWGPRLHLGLYLLGMDLVLLSWLPELIRGPLPPSLETQFYLGGLTLAFVAVGIPFLGCFIGHPPERAPSVR